MTKAAAGMALLAWLVPARVPAATMEGSLAHLGAGRCEAALLELKEVALPTFPSEGDLSRARRLALDAGVCRREDPVIGWGLTEVALRVAPKDPEVLAHHAESFLALKQRGEAASLLDRALVEDPTHARARFLRGSLAAEEGEHAVAAEYLRPLKGDPVYGERATTLIAASEAEERRAREARAELVRVEQETAQQQRLVAVAGQQAAEAEPRRAPDSGKLVAKLNAKIGVGGDRTVQVKGVKKGRAYVLRASAECSRKGVKKAGRGRGGKLVEDPRRDIFGIDFAVQVGGLEPRQLAVGQGRAERSEIPFVADGDNPTVRLFDRGHPDAGVRCTVGEVTVVVQ